MVNLFRKFIRYFVLILITINIKTVATEPLELQIGSYYNTYSNEYKFLSVVNGLLILKNSILRNVRFNGRYGAMSNKYLCHYQITHPGGDYISRKDTDCPLDRTSEIVQHSFPSPAGGILRENNNKHDLFGRLEPEQIGTLMSLYVQYKKAYNDVMKEEDLSKKEIKLK